jgi:hypothetical protein
MFGYNRRHKRTYYNPPRKAMIKIKGQSNDVDIKEISRCGLRFISGGQYGIGEKLEFELPINDGEVKSSLFLKGKVVNEYKPDEPNDLHDYGIEFTPFRYLYEKNCIEKLVFSNWDFAAKSEP